MQVFIDGHNGTTGLQIHERLAREPGIEIIAIEDSRRKNKDARAECLNEADLSILCLPDPAAREAVSLVRNPEARLLDASSAHRTTPQWIYGMPEWDRDQARRISQARRVSNPGCYAIAAIALIRPLIAKGLMRSDYPVVLAGVSGYTGGGRDMIDRYENPENPNYAQIPAQAYALSLNHKHLEEIRLHAGLEKAPLFAPWVGNYRQGMIVQMALHLDRMTPKITPRHIHAALAEFYEEADAIAVMPLERGGLPDRLDADAFCGRDDMQIHLFAHKTRRQAIICAVLDNLGKGAAGTALQNIRLMLSA